MTLSIMKFGAAALGNAGQLHDLAQVVKISTEGGERVVVVCTALSGITDALIRSVRAAADGNDSQTELTRRELWTRHRVLAERLVSDDWEREALFRQWADLLKVYDRYTRAIATLGELPARSVDMIAALGERFIALLVAVVLRRGGVAAQVVEATDLIVTDDSFGHARPDHEQTYARTRQRLQAILKARIVPVVAGYIGATPDAIVTTLGRGGGDYTAALIAAALEAKSVYLWTDVDGIMTADPKIVPEARTLTDISYAEAAEIAALGAEVLHPHTLAPLIEQNITLYIRNLQKPDSPGTRVITEPQDSRYIARGIISAPSLSLLTAKSEAYATIWTSALARMTSTSVDILCASQSQSEQSLTLLVRASDAEFAYECLSHALHAIHTENSPTEISHTTPVALLALITTKRQSDLMSRVLLSLGQAGVRVLSITQTMTPAHITILLDEADVNRAVQTLHKDLELG